jgi:hypothetical protein
MLLKIMMKFNKINLNVKSLALALCLGFFLFNIIDNKRYQGDIIQNDVIQYYSYLPAYFIENDVTLTFLNRYKKIPPNIYWHLVTPDGKKYFKMTMGLSILYSPFFFISHFFAINNQTFPSDGYSLPYKIGLVISTLFYAMLGLWLLQKLLSNYYNKFVVSIVIVVISIGTNFYNYASNNDLLMSHVYSFFLFAFFLNLVVSWFKQPRILTAIFLGLVLGLIALVRPTNAIIGLALIFYGVNNWSELKMRFSFYLKHFLQVIIILFFAIMVWVPQMIYWKMQVGSYLYFSYAGESFFWNNPHIFEILFGFRKGLFIYTPLIILSYFGILFCFKQLKLWRLTLITFIPINIYIMSCWWCWWYGGSFGQRPMIDSFPLLAIPMAELINTILNRSKWFIAPLALVFSFFIYLNIFQSFQYEKGLIHYDSMSKEAYFKIFLEKDAKAEFDYWNLLIPTDSENALKGLPERDLRKK